MPLARHSRDNRAELSRRPDSAVHLTDWSPGSIELPPKEDTPMWVQALASHGVNIVRLHFIDKWAPAGITDGSKNDTQSS